MVEMGGDRRRVARMSTCIAYEGSNVNKMRHDIMRILGHPYVKPLSSKVV